uniref:T-cell receptor alpha/delta variable 11.0.1 n=1 Tax=Denticeps clupeoides TaxID=299321 RepID=A0AAY4ACK3_9TELE
MCLAQGHNGRKWGLNLGLLVHRQVCYTLGLSYEQKITLKTQEHISEGQNVHLSCEYDGLADTLQWYRQYPRSRPEFLLLVIEVSNTVRNATLPVPRLTAELNRTKKRVDLKISSAEVTDSALYYCALEPTVTGRLKKPSQEPKMRVMWHFINTNMKHAFYSFGSLPWIWVVSAIMLIVFESVESVFTELGKIIAR